MPPSTTSISLIRLSRYRFICSTGTLVGVGTHRRFRVALIIVRNSYGPNPFAIASVAHTSIKNSQAYDISITMALPHSPGNLERGNFMVGLLLLSEPETPASSQKGQQDGDNQKESPYYLGSDMSNFIVPPPDIPAYVAKRRVLYSATRSTWLPYRSSLVSRAASLVRLPYYALWPGTETNTVTVRMAERLKFGRGTPVPTSLVVEIQAGQALQVYAASVTVKAQLWGLRYVMYH